MPTMLLKLPITLWSNCNAPVIFLLCSNYTPYSYKVLCSTNSTFYFSYILLHHIASYIASDKELSITIYVDMQYVCMHVLTYNITDILPLHVAHLPLLSSSFTA